jgi:hypothetical protein
MTVKTTQISGFCVRVPESDLARHCSDYGSERLREIYRKVDLRVLSGA